MIDFDWISVDSANWAAERIRELHPLPTGTSLSEMPEKDSTAFLQKLDEHVEAWLGVIGALRRPGRAWVDVRLASGRWVGRWIDGCPAEAAIECAYWWREPITAAGIGLKATATSAEALEARIDSGDLLALLGGEW